MAGNEDLLMNIAAATTACILSFVLVVVVNRFLQRRRRADPAKAEKARLRGKKLARIFTRALLATLSVGLVWTVYFMLVGLFDPAKSEWAANASTLIVSVLTVISIMIAFFEFLQRDKK